VRLELTDSGRRLVDAISSSLKHHVLEVLQGVDSSRRKTLQRDLDRLELSIRSAAPRQASAS
jgi:DNA-binding MarR family transcriptional regulator